MVLTLVRLRTQRVDRRALGHVEHARLDHRLVDVETHLPAERIDLTHKMTLAGPADRRIAGHHRQRRQVGRQHQRLFSHPRTGKRRFAARMPRADDDDIICSEYVFFRHNNSYFPRQNLANT